MDDADRWQAWAHEEASSLPGHDEIAAVRAMPPLLRRRAQPLGRAALEVLYAPTLAYSGQPIVFCSRHGEVSRSTALLQSLAAEGQVSPQEFSMSVHNAIPGLFLIAKQCQAPVASLSSENQLALSGMVEALTQLADGASSVILLFCDAPLPTLFHSFSNNEPPCFAFALEMTAGKDYCLVYDDTAPASNTASDSTLPLLRFFLNDTQSVLPLTGTAGWQLLRVAPEPETRHV